MKELEEEILGESVKRVGRRGWGGIGGALL